VEGYVAPLVGAVGLAGGDECGRGESRGTAAWVLDGGLEGAVGEGAGLAAAAVLHRPSCCWAGGRLRALGQDKAGEAQDCGEDEFHL
jgi:hypothetical protein